MGQMGGTIAEEREALERELERLETLLVLNADWQALRLLKARAALGGASEGAEFSTERAKLEAALERSPVFRQRKLIAETIASIKLSQQSNSPDGAPPSIEDTAAAKLELGVTALDRSALAPAAPASGEAGASVGDGEVPIADRERAAGRRPAKSRPAPASLRSRLRQVQQHTEFDGAGYAAYHSEIGEAMVEIVRRDRDRD
jgi:hypothetical protein